MGIKVSTLLLSMAFLFVGCQQKDMSERLTLIDSLLIHNQVDSAMVALNKISLNELSIRADSAYYLLLKAETRYRLDGPDSTDKSTNFSIDYYDGTSDYEKLSRSYYYKSVNSYSPSNPQDGIRLLKQAEYYAEKTNNQILKHKIYEKLSYYNGNNNEEKLSLYYSKKALHMAKLLNDLNRQAIALLYMASSYSFIGDNDSLGICVNECLPLAICLTNQQKAYLYTRMGELYEKSEPEIAKKYLSKALGIHPQPRTYLALSNLYLREDSLVKVKEIWNRALKINRISKVGIAILSAMRQQSLEQKDYGQANVLADSIILLQQKFYETKEKNKIAEIQVAYDKESVERNLKERVLAWTIGVFIIVVVIVGWLGYKSWRGMKAKKNLAETKLQLEVYTQKASQLENSQRENVSEINKLNKKIENLRYRQSGILAQGKELFDAISNGCTTVRWGKDDFINYLEYYKLRDLSFINEMETEYERLSPKYIFFTVLEHEGYSNEDIKRIMGISESTLRSTRSRINGKKLNSQNV